KLLWPQELIFIYPRWRLESHWLLLFTFAAAAVVAVLWLLRKRIGRGPITAAFFFIGTAFPTLGLMDSCAMRFSFVADHWQYLASLGVIALAGAVPAALPIRDGRIRFMILATPIVVLAALSWRQCFEYK